MIIFGTRADIDINMVGQCERVDKLKKRWPRWAPYTSLAPWPSPSSQESSIKESASIIK